METEREEYSENEQSENDDVHWRATSYRARQLTIVSESAPPVIKASWNNERESVFSILAYTVGLGNVLSFPRLVAINGGGSFLIPYTLMVIFLGFPLLFLELALGQYSAFDPARLFGKMAPIAIGLGHSMVILNALCGIYYNAAVSWFIFYMCVSLKPELPWTKCPPLAKKCNDSITLGSKTNGSWSPVGYYFHTQFLGEDATLDTNHVHDTNYDFDLSKLGGVKWWLALSLMAVWIVACLTLIRGIRSSGKVIYFTVIAPEIILCILFAIGLTLDGASEGILFYFTPTWDKLQEHKVILKEYEQYLLIERSMTIDYCLILKHTYQQGRPSSQCI